MDKQKQIKLTHDMEAFHTIQLKNSST